MRKQTLGGHKQNLVCTRTQEKGALAPQETDPDLPVSVQESLAEAWVDCGPAAGVGALGAAVPAWDLLKEVSIIFTTSTIVWPQVKQQGTHQNKTQFPLSQSLPSGNFHKPLILLHQRAGRMTTTITEN